VTPAADIKQRVEAYYVTVSAGDIDSVAAMFTPAATMRDPVGAPPACDDAARRQRYAGIRLAFDAFAIAARTIIVGGDEAAAAWIARATAKDGRAVEFSGISTFVFDAEGRITAMSAYLDLTQAAAAASGSASQ
jgi:ketosteroid isomerase-like protein